MTTEELEIEEWRQADREDTAYHEACHFVMTMLVGGAIPRRVTIKANGEAGYSGFCGGDAWCDAGEVLRSLAGVYAEKVLDSAYMPRDEADMERAEEILQSMYGDEWEGKARRWEHALRRYYDFTWKVLSYRSAQKAVRQVAKRLCESEDFAMDAVYPLLDDVERALGNRRKWLCSKVDTFMRETVTPL